MNNQLPKELLLSLQDAAGFDSIAFEQTHQQAHPLTSIRINQQKIQTVDILSLPFDHKIEWSSNGYYLTDRPSFTLDPLFHAGTYYVQEASSMFLEEVLKQTSDLSTSKKVLDLCAAPGGKSTLIQSLISTDSLLICNEVIKTRVTVLSENITKWGASNVVVTNNDPKDFDRLPGYFDIIVADAPCSGSGMFRKDNEAIKEWSIDNVALCSQRQQRILSDVLPALKEDGILIYSTCSYSTSENEDIADWLIEEHQMERIQIAISNHNIIESQSKKHNAYGYRFYPDKIKGEGFFICALRKRNSEKGKPVQHKSKSKQEQPNKTQLNILNKWVSSSIALSYFFWEENIIAMTELVLNEISFLQKNLYLKKAGIQIGSFAKNDLIPSHELALSTIINPSLPSIEVDLKTALDYLRLSNLDLPECPVGWTLVKYNQVPLGWIKKLPNRINNYYPKEWKILNK